VINFLPKFSTFRLFENIRERQIYFIAAISRKTAIQNNQRKLKIEYNLKDFLEKGESLS